MKIFLLFTFYTNFKGEQQQNYMHGIKKKSIKKKLYAWYEKKLSMISFFFLFNHYALCLI